MRLSLPLHGCRTGRFSGVERNAGRRSSRSTRTCRRSDRAKSWPLDRAPAKRGRQDDRRLCFRGARGGGLLSVTMPETRAACLRRRPLPGPTGESNELRMRGRGVFVCISPWNFPLAIFTGQVVAALAAGNCVVAKPAEQTPLMAFEAVRLLHRAGVPPASLNLVPGDGKIGAHSRCGSPRRGRCLHGFDRGGARRSIAH